MTAAFIDRTLNGNHTFSCALTTRGGVCDCWPEDGSSLEDGSSTVSTAPMADSLERRDRVAAGLVDYAADDMPPAADPQPAATAEAVDEARRGLRDS
jgi:hypothetical protein